LIIEKLYFGEQDGKIRFGSKLIFHDTNIFEIFGWRPCTVKNMPNLFHREEELDTAQLTTENTGTRSTA
jgi:hypothetical protein